MQSAIMSHKRPPAPLPIFNKGKRPRQALIAHPNNQGGIVQEPVGQKQNTQVQCYDELFRQGGRGQENRAPYSNSTGWTNVQRQQPSGFGNSTFTPYKPSLVHATPKQEKSVPHVQFQQRVGQVKEFSPAVGPPSTYSSRPVHPSDQNTSATAVGNATALAFEPTETANLVGQPERPRKRELRVLTATAQGIEHWSQYGQHTQLLYEVYGMLVSITRHSEHAQLFTLKTPDSTLKCIYWEMEQPFPSGLRQGQGVRVVGDWQATQRRLKCYSMRAALKGEADMAEHCVMASDRHMRKLVQNL